MTADKPPIDFHFFASLAQETGACIEIEENGRIYRFRPRPAPVPPVERQNTEAPAAPPKPMTPAALAKRWLCSERHVRNMINSGELQCFRLGGKLIRILPEDIAAKEATGSVPIDEPIDAQPPSAATPPRKKPAERLTKRRWDL